MTRIVQLAPPPHLTSDVQIHRHNVSPDTIQEEILNLIFLLGILDGRLNDLPSKYIARSSKPWINQGL